MARELTFDPASFNGLEPVSIPASSTPSFVPSASIIFNIPRRRLPKPFGFFVLAESTRSRCGACPGAGANLEPKSLARQSWVTVEQASRAEGRDV